jgi:hypothetical protein
VNGVTLEYLLENIERSEKMVMEIIAISTLHRVIKGVIHI